MKKSVLITGASGNLGTAVLKKFTIENYHIYATGLEDEELHGINIKAVDLTNEEETQQYVQTITADQPDLRAAILLVGGFAMGNIAKTDGAALQKMYKLNFETAYFMVRALLPFFEEKGGGQFVLIGTRPAFEAEAAKDLVAYGLSKSLVMYLSEIINAHGEDKGITSSVIVPSIIDTPENRKAMSNADFSKWVQAEDIADAIHFLLTDAGKNLRETVLKMYNEA